VDRVLQWLYDMPFSTAIREDTFLFPFLESIHVLAIALVVGSISIVDFRLLGIASKSRPITELTRLVLPLTWAAFATAAIAGALLFSSNAVKYAHNQFFIAKMALILLAFANMLVFHAITQRNRHVWDGAEMPPWPVRAAGGLSLLIWAGVVACGRWIGFTINSL
jgi:hypothetical protein